MTRNTARLIFGLSLVQLALAGTFLPACDTTPAATEAVSLTSTVALTRESAVVLVAAVPIEVTGTLVGSDVIVSFEGAVTASTAEQAKAAAAAVVITQVSDAETMRIELQRPAFAQALTGLAKVSLPRGVRLAVSSGGAVYVGSMDRSIQVEAAGDAIIEEARESVSVVSGSAILLSSRVPASSTLDAQAAGNIELVLPTAVSAEIDLAVAEGAQILIQHPGLPVPVSQTSSNYRTVVRGGSAVVRAVSGGGNISVQAF